MNAPLDGPHEMDFPGVTEEGEPPTETVPESRNNVEDDDVDLEVESDVVTFENAAFVFLEALKRKLKKTMDNFEYLTLDLLHIFIEYGIGSLTQPVADAEAKKISIENPLEALTATKEFTFPRLMKAIRKIDSSLSSATDFFYDEEDNHEMDEAKRAKISRAASKANMEKNRFIEKIANSLIRVLIKLGLVRVFALCTNLCTVDCDPMDFTKKDKPTEWTCPFCQTVNKTLQPGSFSSRSQQLIFIVSPRLHIACLFEDPSTANIILQNSSKYHSQSSDNDTCHTFYNGEYVKRMKQLNKQTMLSNEQKPQISSTKYFDESEVQLAVTLGCGGITMFNKSVTQLKEPPEIWPLVMRLVDFNSNTDFQLINFPPLYPKNIDVDSVGDKTGEKDKGDITPSMLSTEITNTKILLSHVTDEFVKIQRNGMCVKNHTSKFGDSPVLTVHATVVNFFGELPALTKFAALRGAAGDAPCFACNEVRENLEHRNELCSGEVPVTTEYNKWLSSKKDGSSVSWAEKFGSEFEHLKYYVEKFNNEGSTDRKAATPFSMTASLTGEAGRFLQKDAEFRAMLKGLCQWVKVPSQCCNPEKHGKTDCCNDFTHMRLLEKRLEELLGVVSLDIGSCTPIYDFDLSMGQNKIIGFDVMHSLCGNIFPEMLRLVSDYNDDFLLDQHYALPAHILKKLITVLKSSLGASDIWPSEFGGPPNLADTLEVYLKAGQAQQLISLLPALLSSDCYSPYLDSDFLRAFQLFAKMSKFLLGHNIRKSEIPILDSTIKEFCSLHRYLFYEKFEDRIKAWQLQAQNNRKEAVPGILTQEESFPHEIPEVKLMVRMGSNHFHILIHVMTLVKEYGHSGLFSCYGLHKAMTTIKSTNNSTFKILTSTGRNMVSKSISNCLSVVASGIDSLQTSLLSRPSTDVERNIAGHNILVLAKPIVQFDVTREAFGQSSFNIEVIEKSKKVDKQLKLISSTLLEDHPTMNNSVGDSELDRELLTGALKRLSQEYSSKKAGSILDLITSYDTSNSLEMSNKLIHFTKLYERLLDGTERPVEVASTDEAATLSLYVIRDYKMYPSGNPIIMKEICLKWKAICGDPKVAKALAIVFKDLLFQATNDSDMTFYHSQCCVTECSKCETNIFTLEMPFLISPRVNEKIMGSKKFVLAHINEDMINYLRKEFAHEFVISCSSPSESIRPATLSVLDRIMRDQNIEKVHSISDADSPNPIHTLKISLCDLLSNKLSYNSVFKESVCVIRSFQGDETKPRYKLAIILQLIDMKWYKKPLSQSTVFKAIRRRHITSALAFVSDLDIEPIHVMPSSPVESYNGNVRTEEWTDTESRSAIGLKISAKAKMQLTPLLLDYFDEGNPRSSWFSDSADSDDDVLDPLKSSALISLSSVIVGKAGLLFHGDCEPTSPKSGFIQIQMSHFNQFEFMSRNEL